MVIVNYSNYLCDKLKYQKRAPIQVHGDGSDYQRMVEAMQASIDSRTDTIAAPQELSLRQFLANLVNQDQSKIPSQYRSRIDGGIGTACSFISNSYKVFKQLLEAKGIQPEQFSAHLGSLQNFVSQASKLPMQVFKSLNDFLKYGNATMIDPFSNLSDGQNFQISSIELDEQNQMGINHTSLDRFISEFKCTHKNSIDFDKLKEFSGCLANYLNIGDLGHKLVELITKLYAGQQLTTKNAAAALC